MTERATIADISAYLIDVGVPHTVYPAHPDGFDDEEASLSFRPKDADWGELLEWNSDHGWTLSSQEEPSPVVTVALDVDDPTDAGLVAAAVVFVYTGEADNFRTISYGDRRYT